jgi:chromate transporter
MIRATEIFLTFARISITSFGGANFWMRRVLVEDKRWVTDREYLEGLAIGQLIPGPNVYNLALMLGHRFGGYRGALAAAGGLLGPPIAIVIMLGLLYQHFGNLPVLQRALGGMTSVAAGLVLANSISLALALPRRARSWLFLLVAFIAVGALRWPLVLVLGGLAPFAIGWAWRESAASAKAEP